MSDIEMKTEHAGFVIKWNDYSKFTIYKDNEELKKNVPTLEDCQQWIINQSKKKFKRVEVLYNFTWGDDKMEPGIATSIIEGDSVWVVSPTSKTRKKAYFCNVWLDTPENREILAKIKEMNAQIKKLSDEILSLQKSAKRLTYVMMLEGNNE